MSANRPLKINQGSSQSQLFRAAPHNKECSNYQTIVHISHARKVMLKMIQARLQQYVNWEYPVQAGFRNGKGPEAKSPAFVES